MIGQVHSAIVPRTFLFSRKYSRANLHSFEPLDRVKFAFPNIPKVHQSSLVLPLSLSLICRGCVLQSPSLVEKVGYLDTDLVVRVSLKYICPSALPARV